MSAESTVVFFGLQFEVPAAEVELLELKRHPLLAKARAASLQHYWADFGDVEPRYFLIIGRKLAIVGLENDAEVTLGEEELSVSMAETSTKLRANGFSEEPQLILKFLPST